MAYIVFLQIVAFLATYFASNLKPLSLFSLKDFGTITFSRPAPPPQIYLQTSADWADEYYLSSLGNRTATTPRPIFPNDTDFSGSSVNTDQFFCRDFPLPRLNRIFNHLVKVVSWMLLEAAGIVAGTLHTLILIGTPATAAWALKEQRSRDFRNLEMGAMSTLVISLNQAGTVDWQELVIADLRAERRESGEGLESQNARFSRLKEQGDAQRTVLETAICSEREDSNRRIEQITQDRDALRQEHDAFVGTIQDLRAREKAGEDTIRQLEAIVQRQEEMIKRRDLELEELHKDSSNKLSSYEAKIADHEGKVQKTVSEAKERFNQAQDAASQRISELEQRLKAQAQPPGPKATKKLQSDLKEAREHITRLQSTIRSNWQELNRHRERARAQRQQAAYQVPMPFVQPPVPLPPPQFSQGQSRFTPYAAHIPGFPPNRTSGFMGNTPPPGWGTGAG